MDDRSAGMHLQLRGQQALVEASAQSPSVAIKERTSRYATRSFSSNALCSAGERAGECLCREPRLRSGEVGDACAMEIKLDK